MLKITALRDIWFWRGLPGRVAKIKNPPKFKTQLGVFMWDNIICCVYCCLFLESRNFMCPPPLETERCFFNIKLLSVFESFVLEEIESLVYDSPP